MPKRVLIVDDKFSIRNAIRGFLSQRQDLEIVGEAADGAEAVEKAQVLQPDLVLLDFSMPIMNGAQAASILKKKFPNISIILFTLDGDVVGETLKSVGVDAVLSKLAGLDALMKGIDAVLAKESDEP